MNNKYTNFYLESRNSYVGPYAPTLAELKLMLHLNISFIMSKKKKSYGQEGVTKDRAVYLCYIIRVILLKSENLSNAYHLIVVVSFPHHKQINKILL